jgi:hypothetical protein
MQALWIGMRIVFVGEEREQPALNGGAWRKRFTACGIGVGH